VLFRSLRIGTAQPTAADLAVCPHHLIDFVSPNEKYDAIRFRKDFERVYQAIIERGGVPILVGGAGMYLTALREGFMEIPHHSPERLAAVREELNAESDETIRRQLEEVDPESCLRIHINDRYRNQRALEIYRISNQTMTELTHQQVIDPALGLSFPSFVLEREVEQADQRIRERTAFMLENGWIEETENVLASHDAGCPGLRSIGYREIVQYLAGDLSREELASAIVLVTRQYAKRQRTMFRHLAHQERGRPDDEKLRQSVLNALAH